MILFDYYDSFYDLLKSQTNKSHDDETHWEDCVKICVIEYLSWFFITILFYYYDIFCDESEPLT